MEIDGQPGLAPESPENKQAEERPGSRRVGRGFGAHYHFSVPAGKGGGDEHAAGAGGSGPAFHQ